jgi:hypothetical protein
MKVSWASLSIAMAGYGHTNQTQCIYGRYVAATWKYCMLVCENEALSLFRNDSTVRAELPTSCPTSSEEVGQDPTVGRRSSTGHVRS